MGHIRKQIQSGVIILALLDRYERLFRYVWLEMPEDVLDYEEVRTKMVDAILLDHRQGRCRKKFGNRTIIE